MKRLVARVITFLAEAFVYVVYWGQVREFRRQLRRWPRPGFPLRYSDRLLWRKVFDHDPRFVVLSDKLAVKDFVRNRVGDAVRTARVLWSGKRPEDIPAEHLRGDVMVKPNHSWNALMQVRAGVVDRDELIRQAHTWLKREHHVRTAEWAYSMIDRKLFIEEMSMADGVPVDTEYKFMVFGGRARFANVITGRFKGGPWTEVMDRDGVSFGGVGNFPAHPIPNVLTPSFFRARDIAEQVCAEFDFMRCDFYAAGEALYISELTVYPSAGWFEYKSDRVMSVMNAAWDLRLSAFVQRPPNPIAAIYAWALRVLSEAKPAVA